MGRRLDDTGAAVALSTLRHFGDRQRSNGQARRRTLVSAMALRPLARRQRTLTQVYAATHHPKYVVMAPEPALYYWIGSMSPLTENVNDALENSAQWSRSTADRFVGGARDPRHHRRNRPLPGRACDDPSHKQFHRTEPDRALVAPGLLRSHLLEPEKSVRRRRLRRWWWRGTRFARARPVGWRRRRLGR